MNKLFKFKNKLLQSYYKSFLSSLDHLQELLYSVKYLPYLEKLTDERSKLQNEVKLIQDFVFPFYQYPELNHHFLKYLTSAKDPRDAAFNKSNLMIISGPEGVGKTWFMKYNLKTLDKMDLKTKPFTIYWDLECEGFMNFEVFFYHFKTLLTGSLSKIGLEINQITGKPLLTIEIIKQVLYYTYADEYIEIFAKDVIKCLLNDEEEVLINQETKEELSLLFSQFLSHKGKGLFFKKNFDVFVKLLQKSLQIDELSAYISFTLLIISKIEHEHRPKAYHSSKFSSGIEQTDFFFDILNHISGYHDLNLFTNDEKLYDMPYIFKKYPHISLLFANFDHFLDSYPSNPFIKDFFDHLILRLFTATRCRTHFPVVIESGKSRLFNRRIWEMMHQCEENFPTIEVHGMDDQHIPTNLSKIYNFHQLKVLMKTFGGNLKDWHDITREFLQGEKKESVWDVGIDMKGEVIERERRRFGNKISKLYCGLEVMEELDDGSIDFKILEILEKMVSYKYQGAINVNFPINDIQFLENPIFQSLIDCNILFHMKYEPLIQLQKRLYFHFIKELIRKLKKKMSFKEKLAFFLHKRLKGLDYSIAHPGLRNFGHNLYDQRFNFDHEVVAYRQKDLLDNDYDKEIIDKK